MVFEVRGSGYAAAAGMAAAREHSAELARPHRLDDTRYGESRAEADRAAARPHPDRRLFMIYLPAMRGPATSFGASA